ncbi:MAG: DegT/DnrJ/EryC1/StrS family aminotransferase, partial [Planctomycetota bacterium]|nr:DegT/DnrJ/EryC1/StrS family aminotransferase [Planctomycetota bacterium]
SALHLALMALGVGRNDEVITVAHTFVATVAAITYVGAKPVLVDVDPERFTMDAARLRGAITPRTRAIIPVHLYGQMADMGPIMEIADSAGIPVIEDAAQAHGATYRGSKAGSLGRFGCFSFYPGKNLGAYGEAGCVLTDDEELALRMCAIRDWGQLERGVHRLPGYNYRMEGLQGAVLDVKLRHLEGWTDQRLRVARQYDELFSASRVSNQVRLPRPCPDGRHVYHQYVIRVKERDRLREELARRGVQTGVHYSLPVHLQPVFSGLGYEEGDFPEAERMAREVASLPIYPELDGESVRHVVEAVEGSLTAGSA